MKLAWRHGWILAAVAMSWACAPEQLELGDAPLESAGGSASAPGDSANGGEECVSPTQHPERAFDEGVTFCACDGEDDQCADTAEKGYIGFGCENGAWTAFLDGICERDNTCYSPTQNAARAYDEGAFGCACDGDEAQCVNTDEAGFVGLICEDGAWAAVSDGPCGLEQGKCFSPTQNPERGLDQGAIGCACDGDEPKCVELPDGSQLGFLCEDGAWTAVNDGPCGKAP